MHTIPTETLLGALKWRYATKQFDPTKKIDDATWQALEDVLVLTPSSFGLQPWKFLVITNEEIRRQLVPVAWNQKQLIDASHVVVFLVKHPVNPEYVRTHIHRMAESQAVPVEQLSGYENVVNKFIENPPFPLDIKAWSTRQVYIALGNFMTAAALLGVDTCPMEGFDPARFDQILGLEGGDYYSVVACPAGYRAETDRHAKLPRVRHDKSALISHLK